VIGRKRPGVSGNRVNETGQIWWTARSRVHHDRASREASSRPGAPAGSTHDEARIDTRVCAGRSRLGGDRCRRAVPIAKAVQWPVAGTNRPRQRRDAAPSADLLVHRAADSCIEDDLIAVSATQIAFDLYEQPGIAQADAIAGRGAEKADILLP